MCIVKSFSLNWFLPISCSLLWRDISLSLSSPFWITLIWLIFSMFMLSNVFVFDYCFVINFMRQSFFSVIFHCYLFCCSFFVPVFITFNNLISLKNVSSRFFNNVISHPTITFLVAGSIATKSSPLYSP